MNRTNEHKTAGSAISEKKKKLNMIRVFGVLAVIAAAAVLLMSMSKGGSKIKTSDSSQTDSSSTAEIKASKPDASSIVSKEQTAKQTQSTAKAAAKATSTEISPKIEVKDGITYVNGILIANKTYSIPSDYEPGLDNDTQAAFNKMQQAAAADGINMWICSGYRSYSYQQQLYDNYVAQDGKAEADRYSARPGHSEHQTGLAIDVNYAGSDFDNTPEAAWLAAHCTDYGFIIRYKPGKESSTGYMAESWHIRYLGDAELCKKIEASGLSLEEYLGITSVYA